MSFDDAFSEIEAEARAEGPDAVADLQSKQAKYREWGMFGNLPALKPEPVEVQKTGKFGISAAVSDLSIAQAHDADDLISHVKDGLRRELGVVLVEALSGGRACRVRVIESQERIETPSLGYRPETVTRYQFEAWVLLMDPRDAQVGEYVWRDLMKPGRPSFVYGELNQTRWSMAAPYAWKREA